MTDPQLEADLIHFLVGYRQAVKDSNCIPGTDIVDEPTAQAEIGRASILIYRLRCRLERREP